MEGKSIRNRKKSFNFLNVYSYFVANKFGKLLALFLFFILGAFIAGLYELGMKFIGVQSSFLISYIILFIPLLLYASIVSNLNLGKSCGYRVDNSNFEPFKPYQVYLIAFISTVAFAYLLDIVSVILPPMPSYLKDQLDAMLDAPFLTSFLSVSVLAPLFEEILCRGLILRGLLQRMRPIWAMVISALFFALIHLNIWQAIPAFVIGMFMAYVYYKTGSLKLTIFIHFVNNTFSLLISKIPGLKDYDSFYEYLSPFSYWVNYAVFILIVACAFVSLRKIKIPYGQKSACEPLL